MMGTLIVYCHPYEGSFCHAVLEALAQRLEREGQEVIIDDLYADGFSPAMTPAELADYSSGSPHDPLVERYLKDLTSCDHLALVFPIWWNDAPAMLRGWLDRVLLVGSTWDVGPDGMVGLLGGIQDVTLYTTSDNPTEFLENVTGDGIRRTLLDGTFMQLGIERRIWHNFGCVSTATDAERAAWLHGVATDTLPASGDAGSGEASVPDFIPWTIDDAVLDPSLFGKDYLYELIRVGQPIARDTLYRKYAQRFYTGRATSTVRRDVDGILSLIKSQIVDCSLPDEDPAYRTADGGPIVPRLAGSRSIAEIPLAELVEDVVAVARSTQRALPRADFIREVASTLGYKQAGRQIRECIGHAIDYAQKKGRVAKDRIIS